MKNSITFEYCLHLGIKYFANKIIAFSIYSKYNINYIYYNYITQLWIQFLKQGILIDQTKIFLTKKCSGGDSFSCLQMFLIVSFITTFWVINLQLKKKWSEVAWSSCDHDDITEGAGARQHSSSWLSFLMLSDPLTSSHMTTPQTDKSSPAY